MADRRLTECLRMLELSPGATAADLRAAYRRLCKRYHPDRYTDPERVGWATELTAELNAAYAYLLIQLRERD
jgi:molecular chaperone DnaJ